MNSQRSKLIFGVGVNDADYVTQKVERVNGKRKQVWMCPYYRRWRDMLGRCYSKTCLNRDQTYRGCSVCDEWLIFSNFRNWMKSQNWESRQLDKDLLVTGNKVYSPNTSLFVHKKVNMFVTDCGSSRGEWPLGVSFNKSINKFTAYCRNPFAGKAEYIGVFTCPHQAHEAWRERKHSIAQKLADSEFVDDQRLAQALRARYALNPVEDNKEYAA